MIYIYGFLAGVVALAVVVAVAYFVGRWAATKIGLPCCDAIERFLCWILGSCILAISAAAFYGSTKLGLWILSLVRG